MIARPIIKKTIAALGGVAAGLAVYFLCGNMGLSQQGVVCLAILMWAIVWWVAGILPEYATAILMVVAFWLFANVELTASCSAFSTSTWWMLVAAFGLGAGMKACGLMNRLAIAIIRKFPNTFTAHVAALMAAGTILGPLVPSLSAKTAMLSPIAMHMGDAAGYSRKGKQQQGLFLAMLAGVRNAGPAVISAGVIGYALLGLYPAEVQSQFDMLHWFVAALPWFLVVTALNFLAICLIYRPDEADIASAALLPSEGGATQLASMSLHEKEMLAIVLATVGMWATQPLHSVNSTVVALTSLVAIVACGILDAESFKNDISWTSLVFIGIAVGLASVFGQVGISDWIVNEASPMFETFANNPYAFVLGVGVITILMRFVIVSEMAYVNIIMALLIPLAIAQSVNPWVIGFSVYATVNPWFALYQNPVYLAAYYSVDGEMVRHADMARYCALYMLICLMGLAVSVPYWQAMGLL